MQCGKRGRAQGLTVDTAVSAVGPAPLLLRLVNLDVRDFKLVRVQTVVVGVALRVGEQVQQELTALHRPAALAVRRAGVLRLCAAKDIEI